MAATDASHGSAERLTSMNRLGLASSSIGAPLRPRAIPGKAVTSKSQGKEKEDSTQSTQWKRWGLYRTFPRATLPLRILRNLCVLRAELFSDFLSYAPRLRRRPAAAAKGESRTAARDVAARKRRAPLASPSIAVRTAPAPKMTMGAR